MQTIVIELFFVVFVYILFFCHLLDGNSIFLFDQYLQTMMREKCTFRKCSATLLSPFRMHTM